MIVLGIETSCDETAMAVLELTPKKDAASSPTVKILSNLIASQHEIHAPYGGIYPELASRRHIEVIRPMTEEALKRAGITQQKLGGIAVTHTPGLVGSLLVGLSFAKAYALGLKIPFIGVNHLEGHLNAPFLVHKKIPYPQIGLVVSGGHTALYFIKAFGDYQYLGGTRDDAAGEAFDKVAKILGLGYPGGPLIDKMAKKGNPKAIKFPKPRLPGYDFSFSGLKTFTRQWVEDAASDRKALAASTNSSPIKKGEARAQEAAKRRLSEDDLRFSGRGCSLPPLPDLCASFQETVVDILVEKTLAAAKNKKCQSILVTGGVACNSRLRIKMEEAAKAVKKTTYFAPPIFCTDNAAMITYVGGRYLMARKSSPLSLNAVANGTLTKMGG